MTEPIRLTRPIGRRHTPTRPCAGAAERGLPVTREGDAVILDIEVLPRPAGTPEQRYAHVEAAIAVIQASGLAYEVHALGTTVEGDPDAVWEVARQVHEATITSGAESVVTIAKLQQSRADDPPAMSSLTAKFR